MTSFHIWSKNSGEDLGIYQAATADEAVDALHADAGYSSTAAMCEALGIDEATARAEYVIEACDD